tara:strand:- start:370 stop:2622 length:2253 start_codon:yes stop_codon:yes gene_type:complete
MAAATPTQGRGGNFRGASNPSLVQTSADKEKRDVQSGNQLPAAAQTGPSRTLLDQARSAERISDELLRACRDVMFLTDNKEDIARYISNGSKMYRRLLARIDAQTAGDIRRFVDGVSSTAPATSDKVQKRMDRIFDIARSQETFVNSVRQAATLYNMKFSEEKITEGQAQYAITRMKEDPSLKLAKVRVYDMPRVLDATAADAKFTYLTGVEAMLSRYGKEGFMETCANMDEAPLVIDDRIGHTLAPAGSKAISDSNTTGGQRQKLTLYVCVSKRRVLKLWVASGGQGDAEHVQFLCGTQTAPAHAPNLGGPSAVQLVKDAGCTHFLVDNAGRGGNTKVPLKQHYNPAVLHDAAKLGVRVMMTAPAGCAGAPVEKVNWWVQNFVRDWQPAKLYDGRIPGVRNFHEAQTAVSDAFAALNGELELTSNPARYKALAFATYGRLKAPVHRGILNYAYNARLLGDEVREELEVTDVGAAVGSLRLFRQESGLVVPTRRWEEAGAIRGKLQSLQSLLGESTRGVKKAWPHMIARLQPYSASHRYYAALKLYNVLVRLAPKSHYKEVQALMQQEPAVGATPAAQIVRSAVLISCADAATAVAMSGCVTKHMRLRLVLPESAAPAVVPLQGGAGGTLFSVGDLIAAHFRDWPEAALRQLAACVTELVPDRALSAEEHVDEHNDVIYNDPTLPVVIQNKVNSLIRTGLTWEAAVVQARKVCDATPTRQAPKTRGTKRTLSSASAPAQHRSKASTRRKK